MRNLAVRALTTSSASLILAGLIDADSSPLAIEPGTSFRVDTSSKKHRLVRI